MDKDLSETIIKKYYHNDISITFIFCYSYYSNIQYKYSNILKLVQSKLIPKEKIVEYISFIGSYNKHVNSFIRIQNKWKYARCKRYDNEYDMTLTVPLSSYKDSEIFSFVQNNTIYTFVVSDLLKVIQTSLLNSEYCTEKPKKPKNPYNNLIISRTVLYNLYIHCKNYNIIIPYFVNEYYKCGFWLRSFACKNNFKLSQNAIKNYIYYANTDELYEEVYNMFEYLDSEEYISNYNMAEDIQLISPQRATESYKKNLNNICKKMLEPYFMHLYKVQHDAILNAYYTTLMLYYLRKNIQNYGLFWRNKVKTKRDNTLNAHRLFGSFTQPSVFEFKTDFNSSNNGFHFDPPQGIIPNHTFNFNTMRNENEVNDLTDEKQSEPEELNEEKSEVVQSGNDDNNDNNDNNDSDNNFDSDIDKDKEDQQLYSINLDISYNDHTNYISSELRESLLDPSATFNFGFEVPENSLYVSDNESTDNESTDNESSNGIGCESDYSPMSVCSD